MHNNVWSIFAAAPLQKRFCKNTLKWSWLDQVIWSLIYRLLRFIAFGQISFLSRTETNSQTVQKSWANISQFTENLSKHFQIYRKFEQTFLNLQKILANICKFAAEDVENLKWGRILSLLPYRRRQAKQRLVSEFSFDFPPFSHFLTISKQFPNNFLTNFQTISKQRLNCVNSLPPSTRCAIFPNSRPNSGQDLITICNVLKKFSFDTHTTRRIFVKKQKGEPFFCTDHQISTP